MIKRQVLYVYDYLANKWWSKSKYFFKINVLADTANNTTPND